MYRSMEYLLPPVTVQDIVPPRRKKNEHTPDNLRGTCPMIVPFFYKHGIDLATLHVVRLIHSSTSPAAASHISFTYMLAANATIASELLHARSLTHGQIPELFK